MSTKSFTEVHNKNKFGVLRCTTHSRINAKPGTDPIRLFWAGPHMINIHPKMNTISKTQLSN